MNSAIRDPQSAIKRRKALDFSGKNKFNPPHHPAGRLHAATCRERGEWRAERERGLEVSIQQEGRRPPRAINILFFIFSPTENREKACTFSPPRFSKKGR